VSRSILELPVRPPRPRAKKIPYAGMGARASASTIDGLAVSVLATVPGLLLFDYGFVVSFLVGFAVSAVYGILPVCGPWQATPGKRAMNIMVTRTDGASVDLVTASLRYFASCLSWMPFCIGYIPALLGVEKAAAHDLVCGTRVVVGRPKDADGTS
jgi:uncharacterized RDD family membrane protein YckC